MARTIRDKWEQMTKPYQVIDEWDGVPYTHVYIAGSREECLKWMKEHWDEYERKLGWREGFADGFALIDSMTGRCSSFVL